MNPKIQRKLAEGHIRQMERMIEEVKTLQCDNSAFMAYVEGLKAYTKLSRALLDNRPMVQMLYEGFKKSRHFALNIYHDRMEAQNHGTNV